MTVRALLAAGALLAALTGSQLLAERWKLQYLYDESKSTLAINDLKFASARRGMAVGAIVEKKSRTPVVLTTADGGEHWTRLTCPNEAFSIFLLNDSMGWIVTAHGIYSTTEMGRNWRAIHSSPRRVRTVFFLDELHGFAAGDRKAAWETKDGGRVWTPITVALTKKEAADTFATYTWIDFFTPTHGFISGWSRSVWSLTQSRPDWVEPDAAIRRAKRTTTWITLETNDGGKTWRAATRDIQGSISRIRFTRGAIGLALLELGDGFPAPAAVVRIDSNKHTSTPTYSDTTTRLSTVAITPSGTGYIAGSEVFGSFKTAPIPGKLKVLRSRDLTNWAEMEVDYRAAGIRTFLAAVDDANLWIATDAGAILKLMP